MTPNLASSPHRNRRAAAFFSLLLVLVMMLAACGGGSSSNTTTTNRIKSCFDRISHDWLLTHVPMDRVILQKWLKAGYMEKHVLHETTDGTPQGGIISPALSNCALDGLEQLLRKSSRQKNRSRPLEANSPP